MQDPNSGGLVNAAAVAVLTAAVAFAAAQIGDLLGRRRSRSQLVLDREEAQRHRREALLIAFFGEIETLDNFLHMEAERNRQCLEAGAPLEIRAFRIPREVFDANVATLGDLRDSRLVAKLVTLYAIVEHTNAKAMDLQGKGEVTVGSLRYLQDLSACLGTAVHLHAWLASNTAEFRAVEDKVNRSHFDRKHGGHVEVAEALDAAVNARLKVKGTAR